MLFAGRGWRVWAGVRDPDRAHALRAVATEASAGSIEILTLDVAKHEQVTSAVAEMERVAGGVDVLVNNAGYGYFGFVEQADLDEVRANFETNVFGLLAVTQTVLPIMRRQGRGRIINLSSLVGRFAFPLSGPYCATKHAVEALSEALYHEVRGFGIHVSVIQPGMFLTDFQSRSLRVHPDTDNPASPYAAVREGTRRRRAKQAEAAGDPREVAEVIWKAATAPTPRFRYRVGADAEEYLSMRERMTDEEFFAEMETRHANPQ
jgi:NAD(P)-dependent dehydrogenase (short-subunit alcohol dehydrogenase family)